MRARFLLAEVGIGLKRNFTMTFAVIVTVAISLSLLGIGLLSNSQVNAMKDYWYDKIEVSVFLYCDISSMLFVVSFIIHLIRFLHDNFALISFSLCSGYKSS